MEPIHGNPDGDGCANDLTFEVGLRRSKGAAASFCAFDCVLRRHTRQHHQEIFAAKSAGDVDHAHVDQQQG